ncbi:MAG TPA: class I SAM-dependent methyltransferase [Hyphomicrobiaceae bacterium]|nr:class I SAM-dependent methyltransferase [Hyphomicrobiaceae bacterium]
MSSKELGNVYAAKSVAEVARYYDDWSATYDTFMSGVGYRHPAICMSLLTRWLPRGEGPILDAGAGTGLVGEWLGIVGYPHVEALDISDGMIAIARKKSVYKAFHMAALGGPLPFPDGAFAGIVSSGVFTTGHVGAEGLDELIRICRPDGVIVLTVKDTLWNGGFAEALRGHVRHRRIRLVDETPPYSSMPGEVGNIPSRAIAVKVGSD